MYGASRKPEPLYSPISSTRSAKQGRGSGGDRRSPAAESLLMIWKSLMIFSSLPREFDRQARRAATRDERLDVVGVQVLLGDDVGLGVVEAEPQRVLELPPENGRDVVALGRGDGRHLVSPPSARPGRRAGAAARPCTAASVRCPGRPARSVPRSRTRRS